MPMEEKTTSAQNYGIYRALIRMGFGGVLLTKSLLYFCSLPPSSASYLLNQMRQVRRHSRKHPE